MKKILFYFLLLLLPLACEELGEEQPDENNQEMAVSSEGISMSVSVVDIKGESAVFTGKITYLTNAFIIDLMMGIELSEDSQMEKDVKVLTVSEVDKNSVYTIPVSSLSFGNKYYYRPFIKANGITKYGDLQYFETLPFNTAEVEVKEVTSSTICFEMENLLRSDFYYGVSNALLYGESPDLKFVAPGKMYESTFNENNFQWLIWNYPESEVKSGHSFKVLHNSVDGSSIQILGEGLKPNTTYYYCSAAYDPKDGRVVLGEVKSVETKPYEIPADVTDLSSEETANSYIVNEAKTYKFKAVKGPDGTPLNDVADVEVLCEMNTLNGAWSCLVGEIIKVAAYNDGYIYFEVRDDSEYIDSGYMIRHGNAILAAKDKTGRILWSWHIWLSKDPINEITHKGITFMDRNLGALPYDTYDCGLGLFYQWGRKDPFPGNLDMFGDFSYFESSSRRWPDPVAPLECTDFDYVIEHPTTRINSYWSGNGSGYYDDWLSEDSSDQTLVKRWSPEKTAFDPCPPGWRVPDAGVFSTIDFSNAIFDRRLGYLVDGDVFPVRECNPNNLCKYFTSGLNADGTVISMNLAESDIRQTSWGRKIEYGYIRCQKDDEVDNSVTIQDVLYGEDGEIFTVTGYIRMVSNWDYGNYTIVDHTGEVYVYGTLDPDGNSKNFTSMGIKEGDFVTLTGPKNTYNGRTELVDVKVEKHNPVYDVSVEEFLNNSTATDKYYRLKGKVENISDGLNGCFYLKDHSGSVYVSGVALTWGGKKGKFDFLGIEEGDIVTIAGVKGTSGVNSAFYISHQRLVKDVTIAYGDDVEDQVKYAFEYDDRFRISRIRFSELGEDGEEYEDVYDYSENQISIDRILNGKTTPIYVYHLDDMGLPVKMEIRPNQTHGGVGCFTFYPSGKVKALSEEAGEPIYLAKWSPEGNMTEFVAYSDIVETFKFEYYNIENRANIDFGVFEECNPFVIYGLDKNVFSCLANRFLLKSCEMCSATWKYELNLKNYVSKFTISYDDDFVTGSVTYMN